MIRFGSIVRLIDDLESVTDWPYHCASRTRAGVDEPESGVVADVSDDGRTALVVWRDDAKCGHDSIGEKGVPVVWAMILPVAALEVIP